MRDDEKEKEKKDRGRFTNIEEDWQPNLGRRGEDHYGEGHPRRETGLPERPGETAPEPRTSAQAGFLYGSPRDDLYFGPPAYGAVYHASSGGRASRPDYRGRGPKNYKRPDESIYDDVNRRLSDDDFVDASDLVVEVRDGEVTLAGMVPDRPSKRRAEDIAESVSGVRHIENRIRVQRHSDYHNRDGNSENRTIGDVRSNINETSKQL